MVSSKLLLTACAPFLASVVSSLPVAEDVRTPQSAVDGTENAAPSTDSFTYSPLGISTERAEGQSSSSDLDPELRIPSIAHAQILPPLTTDAKVELKRDDIRKYDRPRPWAYEDYRAIQLAALARYERERAQGGNGRKGKRISSSAAISDRKSSTANSAEEKRDSTDGSGFPPTKDNNDSDVYTDKWGLSQSDYEQFLNSHLNADYPQWTIEEWQDLINRYLEFQASGGQVGKGGHKRDALRQYHDSKKPGMSSESWQMLEEWLERNSKESETLAEPDVSARLNEHLLKQERSKDRLDSPIPSQDQVATEESSELGNKNLWTPWTKVSVQQRDDIRRYGEHLTDAKWDRLYAVSTTDEMDYMLEARAGPKVKRQVDEPNMTDDGFEQLSAKDIDELHKVAMADPEFLEFQRHYIANHPGRDRMQKRAPLPPITHQTAPVHRGSPPSGSDNAATRDESPSPNTANGHDASTEMSPVNGKRHVQHEKRDDIQKYEDFDENWDKVDENTYPSSSILPRDHHHKANRRPPPDLADGWKIAKNIAVEEASDLPEEGPDIGKRDSMYNYPAGLDDYDDFQLNKFFCEGESDDCLRKRQYLNSKRDNMDQYDPEPSEWKDYSELLKAMEEGRLPSFHGRSHARDLTNFPAWTPADDPAPPKNGAKASSKKQKRDTGIDSRDLENFPSWTPADNPAPPTIVAGTQPTKQRKRDNSNFVSESLLSEVHHLKDGSPRDSKTSHSSIQLHSDNHLIHQGLRKASLDEALDENGQVVEEAQKRDKVDQYDDTMVDEDEWIDIYRLYDEQRHRGQQQGSSPNDKRNLRRAAEPDPDPDTVVIRPFRPGMTEMARPTTITNGGVGSGTSLLSLQGATPGPGISSSQPPILASGTPSNILSPFGPLISLGPAGSTVASGRKRRGDGADESVGPDFNEESIKEGFEAATGWNVFAEQQIQHHMKNARGTPVVEQLTQQSALSVRSTEVPAVSSESPRTLVSPTPSQPPEAAKSPPADSSNVSNIIQDYGPVLNLASRLLPPASSASSPPPPAESTTGTLANTEPAREKRDSAGQYAPSKSVSDFTEDDWDVLDNFITFQETVEEPLKRDEESQYTGADAGSDNIIYTWLPSGRRVRGWWNQGNPKREEEAIRPRDNVAADSNLDARELSTPTQEMVAEEGGQEQAPSSQQQQQATASDHHEEQDQQAEGAEQAKTEQSGMGPKLREKRQTSHWVSSEDEVLREERVPENSNANANANMGNAGNAKRQRLPTTTEGEEVGRTSSLPEVRKRRCGASEGLPEGYGSNETAGLCPGGAHNPQYNPQQVP